MRGQDTSMTSPFRSHNENSVTDSFAVKEAQWQAEREKLIGEVENARSAQSILILVVLAASPQLILSQFSGYTESG